MARHSLLLTFGLLFACGLLLWSDIARIRRVRYVSGIGAETTTTDPLSPTGYANGKRWLVVPEHCTPSDQWIAETQQMLANGDWRVRHVEYENAPLGREVHASLLYHNWLALLARLDRAVFQTSIGLAVERASLWSEPTVHVLLLLATTLWVAFCFGSLPALAVALSWVALFPLAASFLPGVPQDLGFAQAFALASVLSLVVALNRRGDSKRDESSRHSIFSKTKLSARYWFSVAGIAGGLGLWNNASKEGPVLLGIALGGMLVSLVARSSSSPAVRTATERLPWREWALSGAFTSLLAYLLEYAPSHLEFRLQVNHPMFALAWLGLGELLTQLEAATRRPAARWSWRNTVATALGFVAIAALPVAFAVTKTHGFIYQDALGSRLNALPDGIVAKSIVDWLKRDGLSPAFAATFLPLLLLGPAVWLLARRRTDLAGREAIALAVGPVVAASLLALTQLRWWSMTDAVLVGLVAALTAARGVGITPGVKKVTWSLLGCALILGEFAATKDLVARKKDVFTRLEIESLVERDLAYWLADHVTGTPAVFLAPPECTPALSYFGGLRGVATPNWENEEGVSATVRIVTCTTADEAQARLNQRSVTHLILPSWDSDLDHFVEWSMSQPADSFLHALHQWALPPWLRALPYKLPTISGFENQSVVVLELTEENERAPSLARLAEYFVETEQFDLARAADQSLQVFPADLGALVARAGVEKAVGDLDAFDKTFKTLVANLAGGNDRVLPWDRRVSLAIVLAQGERLDLARPQVSRCLREIDAERIRSLTTGALFRLQILAKAFDLKIADPQLREQALKPFSPESRSRL